MNKQDIEFLKELQKQMLTQDNCGQAAPRFWVVGQTEREYGIDEDYGCDGTEIIYDGESIASDYDELCKYLEQNHDIKAEYCDVCKTITIDEEEINQNDIFEYMKEELGYSDCLYEVNYRDVFRIKENTLFLTLEECKNHIAANWYHYNKTVHPYCMTAWRSPQISKLYEILEKTDWDKEISNE